MKTKSRRALSFLLVFCMLLGAIPIFEINAHAAYSGSNYTDSAILAERLNTIFTTGVPAMDSSGNIVYLPLGEHVVTSNRAIYLNYQNGKTTHDLYQCAAYAFAVYYYLFGWDIPDGELQRSTRICWRDEWKGLSQSELYRAFVNNNVKFGAYMWARKPCGNEDYGHSMILLDYDEKHIVFLEGNADGSRNNGGGRVQLTSLKWDDFYSRYLSNRGRQIYSLIQPLDSEYALLGTSGVVKSQCAYDHSKIKQADGTYTYETKLKSDGHYAAFCKNCHTEYPINLNRNGAGTYKIKQKIVLCSDPYQEANKDGKTVSEKTEVTIIGSVTNAYGNLWYKTDDEHWIYKSYVTLISSVKPASIVSGTYYIQSYCGKIVEVADSRTNNGANVQIWDKSSRDLGCQKFKIARSGDYYTFAAAHSGKVIDIANGSLASGTNVQQYVSNNSNAQKWQFEDAGNGYYFIRSALGTYLSVANGGTSNGTNIRADKFDGSNAQKFKLSNISTSPTSASQGSNTNTGTTASPTQKYYLDLNGYLDKQNANSLGSYGTVDVYINGVQVANDVNDYYVQWPVGTSYEIRDVKAASGYTYLGVTEGALSGTVGNGAVNVRIIFSKDSSNSIADGTYYIEAYCGKVVEVADSKTGNGANVQIWAKSSRNLGCQKFKITKSGDYYTLAAVHSGKVIDVANGSSASGTNVWQYTSNGSNAQKWQFEDAGGGYYYIRSALGTYMDVYNDNTGNGTNVWAYNFNGSNAQKFKLVKIG